MKVRLNFQRAQSLLISLYFISLTAEHLLEYKSISYLRYLISAVCLLLVFLNRRGTLRISKRVLVFFSVYLITSFFNIIATGNNTLSNIVLTIVYFCLCTILIRGDISERSLFWSTIICCAMTSVKILVIGIGKNALVDLSNNFVSVIVLSPCIIYYVRNDIQNRNSSILPALAVWVTCLLAVGRGGILASSVLIVGFVFLKLFVKKYAKLSKFLKTWRNIFIFALGSALIVAILFSESLISRLLSSAILQRFNRFGFYGTGRAAIWTEYMENFVKSPMAFLWGVDFDDLFHMIRFKNNLHNSFLNVHATNGLIMLVYVIFSIAFCLSKILRNRKWIAVVCIVTFFLRAFTDRIFMGGTSGTLLFFFLLWADNITPAAQKRIVHFSPRLKSFVIIQDVQSPFSKQALVVETGGLQI